MNAKRLIIAGRVHGVGYRQWMVETARGLGVSGWVRNRLDGTVEALVAGDIAAVEELLRACRRGPRLALVTQIDEQLADPPDEIGFHLCQRPTRNRFVRSEDLFPKLSAAPRRSRPSSQRAPARQAGDTMLPDAAWHDAAEMRRGPARRSVRCRASSPSGSPARRSRRSCPRCPRPVATQMPTRPRGVPRHAEAVERADQPFLEGVDIAADIPRGTARAPGQVEHHIGRPLARAVIGPLPAAARPRRRGSAGRAAPPAGRRCRRCRAAGVRPARPARPPLPARMARRAPP